MLKDNLYLRGKLNLGIMYYTIYYFWIWFAIFCLEFFKIYI